MPDDLLNELSVLIVDDDRPFAEHLRTVLEGRGCHVTIAASVQAAEDAVKHASSPFRIAVLDFWIPRADGDCFDYVMRGQELGYELRRRSPKTLIIGISDNIEALPRMPDSPFSSFINKGALKRGHEPRALLAVFEDIVSAGFERKPRCFIVHGHDEPLLATLRVYLRDELQLGEPIVLRDRPALGRTIIEAFEDEANVDVVFVLLTSDEQLAAAAEKRRSRQNVIFELGFFYAKLQRVSGRVFLLRSGEAEIPSDVAGVVYIDVSNGIAAADAKMRAGLSAIGWL